MTHKEQLLAEYNKVMKAADQKLRRLEKLANEPNFEGVLSYSYATAMKDIEYYSGEGAKRFHTKAPQDLRLVRSKIKRAKAFIESPTSDKRSIVSIYKKRAATISKKYGVEMSWQELANYFRSAASDILAATYGSDTVFTVVSKIKKKHDSKSKTVDGDGVTDEIIKNLEAQGIDYDALFNEGVNNASTT